MVVQVDESWIYETLGGNDGGIYYLGAIRGYRLDQSSSNDDPTIYQWTLGQNHHSTYCQWPLFGLRGCLTDSTEQ